MTEEIGTGNTPVNGIVFRGARKTYYSIRRGNVVEIFISQVFSQRRFCPAVRGCWITASTIMISMAQAWRTEEKEALGQAVAGEEKELTEYMLEHYRINRTCRAGSG